MTRAVRRPLRLLDGTGGRTDLDVDPSPDATVGELADRLAALSGRPVGGTVASRWPTDQRSAPPQRDRPLRTHGPRAGSTVELVDEPVGAAAPGDTAPVRLVGPDRDERRLDYGANLIGDTVVEVGDHVAVHALGGATTRVEGAALVGTARLRHGDLLTICDTTWTVRVDGPLQPPRSGGWTTAHARRPHVEPAHPIERVVPPTPPASVRLPGFPVLSATVPLLMGVGLWFATGSLLGAAFMIFSVAFVVASAVEARREARAEDRARVREFHEDLADTVAQLEALAARQRERNERLGRSPQQLHDLLDPTRDRPHTRLWERCSSGGRAPSVSVRLGTATRPLQVVVPLPDTGRRELRATLRDTVERLGTLDDVVVVDLMDCAGLVIESADESGAALARSVVLQLASLLGPDELGVTVLAGEGRDAAWHSATWLPHRSASSRAVHLVLADGVGLGELAATLDQLGRDRVVVVWLTTPGGPRPSGAGAVLCIVGGEGGGEGGGDGGGATLELTAPDGVVERIDGLRVDQLGHDEAEPLARSLAALAPAPEVWLQRPGVAAPEPGADLPDRVTLADLLADPDALVDPAVLAQRWTATGDAARAADRAANRALHLATPIGVAQGGGVVNIDLVDQGPHALVAGTTGSGKSELLRSFLLAAALHHPPDRLHLLLVDYKGGAAFGALSGLPHTVGTVTDLTDELARRVLVSLRAEVRRREELIAAEGADRWSGARLLVVIDEFATLATELPEFVDGLVDLAQRGRSLGIHLVLATQRPAGVVTDAIRANTTLRLALRVADEDDSRDVVDSPAAAHLPRDLPGRAVLRVGPATSTTIQVAWSGADVTRRAAVTLRPLHRRDHRDGPSLMRSGDTDTPAMTQLDAAVATIRAASALCAIEPPRRPWLDPLPTDLRQVELPAGPRPGALVVGLVDRPDAQRHDPLMVDLARDGGVVVVGASGSGRSTALRSLVAAADEDPRQDWHIYVIDAGAALGDLTARASVGDVIGVDETERVPRLLRSAVAEIERRTGAAHRGAPLWLLVVDGIGALEERYERRDRGEAMDLLARIARDGRAAGVHLALGAQRRAEVPVALAGALGARILLRCATPDEAALWGLGESAAAPEVPPGRCWVDGHHAQVAVPDTAPPPARPRQNPPGPVPTLPTVVRLPAESAGRTDDLVVAVGLDGDTLATAHLDLRHHHGIVAGPPRSGVTTALRTLVAHHPRAQLLDADATAGEVATATLAALAAASDGRTRVLAIDDLPSLLDGPEGHEVATALAQVLTAGRRVPLRLVVGGEVDAMAQCFVDAVGALRRGRTGLLLGGDPELHGALWHAQLPHRSDLPPAPGRGWLLGPGVTHRVQVALD